MDVDVHGAERTAAAPRADRVATRAGWGVFGGFAATGLALATLFSRVPAIREELGVSTAQLGLVLLAIPCGSMLALPLSGLVVGRLGSRRTAVATSLLMLAGMAAAALGFEAGRGGVMAGLFVMGLALGNQEVALNVEGAAVEQRVGRSLLPRFHAGFSVGTVAGAALGAAVVAAGVPVGAHMLVVAVGVGVFVPLVVRGFITAPQPRERRERHGRTAWREPRTLAVGAFVLAMGFTEGTGNDWLAVAMVDGYGASQATGAWALAVFVAAMTAGRVGGGGLIDRWGRVAVLRASCGLAATGLALVVFGPSTATAFAGAALWGLGTALGFPVGMSAAGDDPARAAARVSVVASVGYTAFLAGPPLIGLLGDEVGVLRALTVAGAMLVLAFLLASATRPLSPRPGGTR
jgi:predicted MFS family arabinose efflux permease